MGDIGEDFTESELNALTRIVLDRLHHDLESKCDCPLHLMLPEERTAFIDRAIDLTNEQVRNGEIPGFRFTEKEGLK
jgi:hypothetical protein